MRKVRSMRARVRSADGNEKHPPRLIASATKSVAIPNARIFEREESPSDSEESLAEEFQFGIWLRHRRIDGALNRVPPDFYAVII